MLINLIKLIKKNKIQDIIMVDIFSKLDIDFLLNLCILHFIIIDTHQQSQDDDKFYLISVAIDIGRNILNKYLYLLMILSLKTKSILYDIIILLIKINNVMIRFSLGVKLIYILIDCNMLSKSIIQIDNTKQSILNTTINKNYNNSIFTIPYKLPMIVKPKRYTGYLLNDKDYREELLISKQGYGTKTSLDKNNIIYFRINNIADTPFKINIELYNYIISNPLLDTK